MKQIVTTAAVDIALRTMDDDDRRRVTAWLQRLQNWDGNALARSHSHRLEDMPGVYVLKTGDIRIFFQIDGETITVQGIAKKSAIIASGHVPEIR